jgi:AAA ATPase containing von Willebrand factor type A (vWA) domain
MEVSSTSKPDGVVQSKEDDDNEEDDDDDDLVDTAIKLVDDDDDDDDDDDKKDDKEDDDEEDDDEEDDDDEKAEENKVDSNSKLEEASIRWVENDMVDFTDDLMRDFTNARIFDGPKRSLSKHWFFKTPPFWITKNSFLGH